MSSDDDNDFAGFKQELKRVIHAFRRLAGFYHPSNVNNLFVSLASCAPHGYVLIHNEVVYSIDDDVDIMQRWRPKNDWLETPK